MLSYLLVKQRVMLYYASLESLGSDYTESISGVVHFLLFVRYEFFNNTILKIQKE